MQLPGHVTDERAWRTSLASVKEHYSGHFFHIASVPFHFFKKKFPDADVPLSNFSVRSQLIFNIPLHIPFCRKPRMRSFSPCKSMQEAYRLNRRRIGKNFSTRQPPT
jgi:hypothetical protein